WNIFQERKSAEPADDLMSLLAHGDATKDMNPYEMLGNVILLIVGGNDTTRNSMSGGVYALNKFPEEYAKLKANPSLIPNMVSEIIRWQTPLAYMRRTALEDVEMHGKVIRKGDKVAMWYVSGNRDESFWDEDPNRLIIDRKQARNHVSFGFGIHRCVGNRLAELQLRILWEEILERFEHVEVLDEPSRVSSSFVKGYSWLPVICHPK
ncbi:MAG: cytochrome P450, partial [Pseudomonadota bacterium]